MYKELAICIVLIIFIFIGDNITQKYTQQSIENLTNELEQLEQNLKNGEKEEAEKKTEEINENWEKMHNKLAYYIEHDELEKVETYFTTCQSFTRTGNYDLAISELEKTIFVLDHITDKYSFNLENIF